MERGFRICPTTRTKLNHIEAGEGTMEDDTVFQEEDFVTLIPLFKTKKEVRYVLRLRRDDIFQCKYGSIKHNDILGKAPGTVVKSHMGFSFIALPSDLSDIIRNYRKFRYVTQVIYPRDWGLILAFGDILPNEKIVEIGTGSGAFLAFLARRIGDEGWIYSYEKDPERAKIAIKNLESMNIPKRYTIKVKDVANEGIDERNVDTVFIDVPEPWKIIKHAWCALKPGGKIIIYVPTYNQVEKTLKELMSQGFVDIKIKEGFIRDIQVKPYAIRPELKGYYFSAFIIFGKKSMVIPWRYIVDLKKGIF